jgi:photosystem II stability/assembly factor-like uncharacterized protein
MTRVATLIGLLACAVRANAQWIPQQSGTTAEFRGLVATSASVVWASGTRGRVARTPDGGATWKVDSLPGASTLDLRAIAPRSDRLAWVLSAGPAENGQAQIFRTTDATSWTKQYSTTQAGVFLDAIAFWDDRHGIALGDPVGGKLFLLATDDGGENWTQLATDAAPPILPGEAAFAASGTCLIVQGSSNAWIGTGGGPRARVFHSTDRGRTWHVADTPVHAGNSASGIFSVAFSDDRHGVVVGGEYSKPKEAFDNVALSDDGGATWRLARGPLPPGYMSSVAFVPNTNGRQLVAVGLAGTARSNDGGESWAMVDTVAYNSITFAANGDGWAAGPRGRIAKWSPAASPKKP